MQLSGYGRSDWSTKLIRGLMAKAAAGFQSRRGRCHESSPRHSSICCFPDIQGGALAQDHWPGQRATLSALVKPGMKALTIRVNDVEAWGLVLPGDHVLLEDSYRKGKAIQ